MKILIQGLLNLAGYQIRRVQPSLPVDNTTGELSFGPYKIECDNNGILQSYKSAPCTNKFLGRLALCLSESNPELGIVDVGANCGDTAALMRSYSKLPILCIEGDNKLHALLNKNLVQCPDITIIKSYLGEVTGPVSVNIDKEGWNNTLVPSADSDLIVEIVRLDELKHPWLSERKIGLLKIDTEGFDVSIIHGAKRLLEESRPIISFEYNRDNMDAISESGLRVFPYLASLDYEGLMLYDNYGRYFMSTTVKDVELLAELHNFIQCPKRGIYYFDIVAFPKSATLLWRKFRESEIANEGDRN